MKQKGNVMRQIKTFVTTLILINLSMFTFKLYAVGPDIELEEAASRRVKVPPKQAVDQQGNRVHTQEDEDRINRALAFYGFLFY